MPTLYARDIKYDIVAQNEFNQILAENNEE
jgi:hypothetical protein